MRNVRFSRNFAQYELEMAARKQQREMDRQLKAYGREAMELDPKLRLEDAARGVTLEDHQKSLQATAAHQGHSGFVHN